MFMEPADFAAAFPGESDYLECKKGVSDKEFQKAPVTFSNAAGGVILCGVAPDGQAVGVTTPGERSKGIYQAFRHVQNPGRYDLHQLSVGSAVVLVVAVHRREEGFSIANAVAHRSYEATGTAIRIDLRPTSVTITSPGGLPEPFTIEHIREQQAARNDLVLTTLRRLHLAEDQGRGIDRIQDDMAGNLLDAPEFDTDGSSFTVTLKTGGVVTARERAWVRGLVDDDRLDPRSALVLVEVARTGRITNKRVRERLAVDSVDARSILQGLVGEGLLRQVGERGGAEYQIAPPLAVPERIRYTDNELDRMVLELAVDGPVTNAMVRERTLLDAAQARKTLRRLVADEKLVQRGSRRGTRYELP